MRNIQAKVAVSSGEAESNSAATGTSEGIGVASAIRELFAETMKVILSVDEIACRGMLLRTGVGKAKHRSIRQLWVQGGVQHYGLGAHELPDAGNAPDTLARPGGESELKQGLHRLRQISFGAGRIGAGMGSSTWCGVVCWGCSHRMSV